MFFAELADALAAPTYRLALYIGHDGTLVRLLAGLSAVSLRRPSFGSEVVFEVRAMSIVFFNSPVMCDSYSITIAPQLSLRNE